MVLTIRDEEGSLKPHVAVVASPGLGHITPLLELAKLLVLHHSLHVTFLSITTTEASAAVDHLLHSSSLPHGLDVVELPPVDVSTVVPDDCWVLTKVCLLARESFRSLSSVLLNLKPKLRALVIDLFCTDAFEVCEPLSIPVYSFSTTSSAFLAFCLYLPTLDREVECEFLDLPEPVKVPGCSPVRTCDLLDQVRDRKIDEYTWFLYHASRLPMATGLLENSWQGLEPVSLQALRKNRFYREMKTPAVYPVGPVIKTYEPETMLNNDKCIAWLDKQLPESVLFVALGSGGTLGAEQLTELAWGLELSQQRFLLVARGPSEISASGTFFSSGSDVNDPTTYLPQGFVERTEGVGLVVPSWAPQLAVLGHEATGAFFSHCGWNSTLESVANGVPMIAWPMYSEQKMNAAILTEELGVAIRPVAGQEDGVIGREEIARVVRVVMDAHEGMGMRCRAKEFKESARKGLTVGGSSYDALSLVVNEWKSFGKEQ